MNHFLSFFPRIKKIAKISEYLFRSKLTWRKPAQCDVLIYDQVGSETLKPLFDEGCRIGVLSVRGESLNLRVLVRLLWMSGFWKRDIRLSYAVCYVNYAKPKLVITFIDNSNFFYSLSNEISDIKTAFIQNGTRGIVADIFETIEVDSRHRVDFMFVHGAEIGELYSNYIKGEVFPIGSVKNNVTPYLFNRSVKKNIAFISQWHPRIQDNVFIKTKNHSISHEKFFFAESIVLSFLSEWCRENGYELTVIGRRACNNDKFQEYIFFKNLIKSDFIFLSPNEMLNSYCEIDRFEIVTHIDSTLGYESLARGNKTASFTLRGSLMDVDGANFGWPGSYKDNGLFWTNRDDVSNFKKIMDYLRDVSDLEWEGVCSDVMKNIICYEADNKKLKQQLGKIIK